MNKYVIIFCFFTFAIMTMYAPKIPDWSTDTVMDVGNGIWGQFTGTVKWFGSVGKTLGNIFFQDSVSEQEAYNQFCKPRLMEYYGYTQEQVDDPNQYEANKKKCDEQLPGEKTLLEQFWDAILNAFGI